MVLGLEEPLKVEECEVELELVWEGEGLVVREEDWQEEGEGDVDTDTEGVKLADPECEPVPLWERELQPDELGLELWLGLTLPLEH